jgi:hypothetical protein
LRQELAALRKEKDTAAEILQKNLAELDRLRRDNLEVQRLRGELTRLRQQSALAPQVASAPKPDEEKQAAAPPRQVFIQSRFIEIDPAVLHDLSQLGIAFPAGQTSAASGETLGVIQLSAQQVTALTKCLSEKEGVKILAAPSVKTVDGREARIAIESSVEVNGEAITYGPSLSVMPTVSEDGSSISVDLQAMLTEFLGVVELEGQQVPNIRTRSASAQQAFPEGGALLLATSLLSGPAAESQEPPKLVFVLMSSMLVDGFGAALRPKD